MAIVSLVLDRSVKTRIQYTQSPQYNMLGDSSSIMLSKRRMLQLSSSLFLCDRQFLLLTSHVYCVWIGSVVFFPPASV